MVAVVGTALGVILLALFVLIPSLMPVSWVVGAEVQSGDVYVVPVGTNIEDDVYFFGNDIDVAGKITHDLIGAATSVVVTGEVGGSIDVVASDIDVAGKVGRNIRSAAQTLTVSGTVSGDVIVLAGTFELTATGIVKGDVIIAAGTVILDGEVRGEVRGGEFGDGKALTRAVEANTGSRPLVDAAAGVALAQSADATAEPTSTTAKPTATTTANVQVGSTATSAGSTPVAATGDEATGSDATGDDGGQIGDRVPVPSFDNLSTIWNVYRLLAALLSGVLIALFIPRQAQRIASTVKSSPFMTLLAGVASVVVVTVVTVLLLVTVIGIPFALALIWFFTALAYTSQVFVGIALARVLFDPLGLGQGRSGTLLSAIIGVVAIWALRLVPLESWGSVVNFIVVVICWGATMLTIFRAPAKPVAA